MLNLAVVIDCIPSADCVLALLAGYLYIAAVATVLLLVWLAVGELINRFAPHFGEYKSNVVDLQERRQQLGATAYRRAIR